MLRLDSSDIPRRPEKVPMAYSAIFEFSQYHQYTHFQRIDDNNK